MKDLRIYKDMAVEEILRLDNAHQVGIFIFPEGKLGGLPECTVIASCNGKHDHVSIVLTQAKRCPTWEEMCIVKDAFFESDEEAIQIHPPHSEYVNLHPFALHLWRFHDMEIKVPKELV